VIFKSLFRGAAKAKSIPEEQLPVLHSFVDVTVMGRSARSVSVEEVGGAELVVGDVVGRSGERAVIVYQTPAGKFRFGSTIVQAANGMTHFRMPERVESLGGGAQKRSSVRMDVLVSGSWRLAPGGQGAGEFMKASIRDISRGGCALIVDRQCKTGQMLEVRLNLRADSAPLTVLGEVMRWEQIPTSGKFSHGLRFHGVTADEDRTILEFITKKQAELRSRGLA
jgi:c-di-GMP-binding flagellar brake protein YcgR